MKVQVGKQYTLVPYEALNHLGQTEIIQQAVIVKNIQKENGIVYVSFDDEQKKAHKMQLTQFVERVNEAKN